jgi:hypothetical protein
MGRVAITVACALLTGCGGSTQAEKPARTVRTATQPRTASVEVSLQGRDLRTVVFDQPLTLAGAVHQAGPAVPLRVHLLADTRPVQSAATGAGGSFEFTVRPRLNTTYSVEVEGNVSRHVRVLALPEEKFRVEPLAPGRGVLVYEITHPAEVTLTRQPVQFYAHFTGHGRDYTRIGQARFHVADRRHAAARVTIALRAPADDAVACVPTMIAPGFGRPPLRDCGRRSVRVPHH